MTYRIIWKWHTNTAGDASEVVATELEETDAETLCKDLNRLARDYGQADDYTVEEE